MAEEQRYPSRVRGKPVHSQFGDDKKEKSELIIGKGKGEELGDIGYINDALKSKGDDFCQQLHRILYGTPGIQRARKTEIRKFSGFPAPWTADQIKEKKLEKLTLTSLKSLCKFFDCTPDIDDPDRDDYEDAAAAFLLKPKGSGKRASSPKKSSSKRSSKKSSKKSSRKSKSKKDKDAPKRPPTAYFVFAKEKRESILKKHPGYSVTEVAKKLGEKWGALSSAEKKPYEKQADAAKEKYQRELKAYKKKLKAKKDSSSDEADSASSSDEKDRKRKDSDSDDDEPKAKKQRKAKPAED